MRSIDEAIRHCEEVAKRAEKGVFTVPKMCKCVEENRKISEWLKELQRARILLKATYDILKKCEESFYVLNVLEQTAIWDGLECDGHCLMEEIEDLLWLWRLDDVDDA